MIHHTLARATEAVLRPFARRPGAEALRDRLVLEAVPAPADIWVHAASVGELVSARNIIETLGRRYLLQITTNSVTGRDLAAEWGLNARLAPLDLPGALNRFLDTLRPRLAITVEGEFWPLRTQAIAARGVPQAVIGARISARSARRWGRLRGIIGPVLKRIDALSAQDEGSEARLRDLGLPPSAILPRLDLKLLAPAAITPPPDDPARCGVWLAASTHEGEEAQILDAWLVARQTRPDLRLILAPRHPRRGDDIAEMMTARGIGFARRSTGGDEAPVLLADTLGEMGRWYARAGLCLIGGTLTDRGGHTPWEPAAYRCAILYGPFVSNHTEGFAALADAGAAVRVSTEDLAAEITALACDPARQRRLGHAARAVLETRAGDPAALIARLEDLANRSARPDISR